MTEPQTQRNRPMETPYNRTRQRNSVAYGVIGLTVITALIHLSISFQLADGSGLVFLLNGIGYLALLAAIYGPIGFLARYRSLLCWVLLAYTMLTVVLWLFIGARGSVLAYVDKVVEIGLIFLLWLEARRFSEQAAAQSGSQSG